MPCPGVPRGVGVDQAMVGQVCSWENLFGHQTLGQVLLVLGQGKRSSGGRVGAAGHAAPLLQPALGGGQGDPFVVSAGKKGGTKGGRFFG